MGRECRSRCEVKIRELIGALEKEVEALKGLQRKKKAAKLSPQEYEARFKDLKVLTLQVRCRRPPGLGEQRNDKIDLIFA